ncbi:MAG: DUF2156 domain-containing protein [Clostridia bacterium]|nr:DUF2156 domain-containing protein [Clostridia bacterium]
MTDFKRITKEDFQIIDKYFAFHLEARDESRFCDYAPGTVKMWCEAYKMEYAVEGDIMLLRARYDEENGTSYLMPIGRNAKNCAKLLVDRIKNEKSVTFSVMNKEFAALLRIELSVDESQIFADRDWSDYIYLREEFCNPSGKKHHNYKYNLNRFKKDHPNAKVEQLTEKNAQEAADFYIEYCKNNPDSSSVDDHEFHVTLPVILAPWEYSMTGAVLRSNGRIIGLTLGEVYGDTVIVHTEKAEKEIPGAYQTLALGYQLMQPETVKYINREEDMGLEGLRRSKLSYGPLRLEHKYTLYYR